MIIIIMRFVNIKLIHLKYLEQILAHGWHSVNVICDHCHYYHPSSLLTTFCRYNLTSQWENGYQQPHTYIFKA